MTWWRKTTTAKLDPEHADRLWRHLERIELAVEELKTWADKHDKRIAGVAEGVTRAEDAALAAQKAAEAPPAVPVPAGPPQPVRVPPAAAATPGRTGKRNPPTGQRP